MNVCQPTILLIGENSRDSSQLAKLLEERGGACKFASSYQEAVAMHDDDAFDLVLSPMKVRKCSVFPLINLLERSRATLFYYLSVELGCWWLPALYLGRKCFGAYAMRPREFIASLELLLDEIRAGAQTWPESVRLRRPLSVKSPRHEYSIFPNIYHA